MELHGGVPLTDRGFTSGFDLESGDVSAPNLIGCGATGACRLGFEEPTAFFVALYAQQGFKHSCNNKHYYNIFVFVFCPKFILLWDCHFGYYITVFRGKDIL